MVYKASHSKCTFHIKCMRPENLYYKDARGSGRGALLKRDVIEGLRCKGLRDAYQGGPIC